MSWSYEVRREENQRLGSQGFVLQWLFLRVRSEAVNGYEQGRNMALGYNRVTLAALLRTNLRRTRDWLGKYDNPGKKRS